jgi:hypothetical protein
VSKYRPLWLWLLVIFVGIQFGAGWYEKLAICPVVGRRIGRSGAGGHGEFGDAYAWTKSWRAAIITAGLYRAGEHHPGGLKSLSKYVLTGSSSATRNCMSGSGGRRTAGRW